MKIVGSISVIVLLLVFLTGGCAHFSKKQVGIISSAPAGAKLTISDDLGVFYEGVTPVEIEVQQGVIPVCVTIEKEGYKTIHWKIPREGDLDCHFVLKKSEIA